MQRSTEYARGWESIPEKEMRQQKSENHKVKTKTRNSKKGATKTAKTPVTAIQNPQPVIKDAGARMMNSRIEVRKSRQNSRQTYPGVGKYRGPQRN